MNYNNINILDHKAKLKMLHDNDHAFMVENYHKKHIIGVDEVGRGCVAGPTVVVAFTYPFKIWEEFLYADDSKQTEEWQRIYLFKKVLKFNVKFGYAAKDNKFIDTYGIEGALQSCYINAVNMLIYLLKLNREDCIVIIDGNKPIKNFDVKNVAIPKADANYLCVAMASNIAKIMRDYWMTTIYKSIYPQYSFEKHKGYGTREHMLEIQKYGISDIHRKSFLKNVQFKNKNSNQSNKDQNLLF